MSIENGICWNLYNVYGLNLILKMGRVIQTIAFESAAKCADSLADVQSIIRVFAVH